MSKELLGKKIAPARTDQIIPILIAMIFLLAPVWLLVYLARSSRGELSGDYDRAVIEARWPNPQFVSTSLVGFTFDHPVTVVTWTEKRWVANYEQPNPTKVGKDVWVTVVPFLKAFCRAYVQSQTADSNQLALRLKEHLGLPPDADYDTFVELTVDPRDNKDNPGLFRPCGDPSLDTTTCKPSDMLVASEVWSNPHLSTQFNGLVQEWMLRNYYSNYATEHAYPWTGLGYTFDWAIRDNSDEFERFGESEFVIPKGTSVRFVSKAATMDYCTSR